MLNSEQNPEVCDVRPALPFGRATKMTNEQKDDKIIIHNKTAS
jgi:hypothetical protein